MQISHWMWQLVELQGRVKVGEGKPDWIQFRRKWDEMCTKGKGNSIKTYTERAGHWAVYGGRCQVKGGF